MDGEPILCSSAALRVGEGFASGPAVWSSSSETPSRLHFQLGFGCRALLRVGRLRLAGEVESAFSSSDGARKETRSEGGKSVLQGEFIVTDASWKERSKRYRVHQVISGEKGWRE